MANIEQLRQVQSRLQAFLDFCVERKMPSRLIERAKDDLADVDAKLVIAGETIDPEQPEPEQRTKSMNPWEKIDQLADEYKDVKTNGDAIEWLMKLSDTLKDL